MPRLTTNQLAWLARLLWLVAAIIPNNLVDSLPQHSAALRYTITIEFWTLWAIVTIALWIYHPLTLTIVRSLAPVITVHLFIGINDADTAAVAIASATCALLVCLIIFTANYGAVHVQAGAYGNEQRLLLRLPVPLILPVGMTYLLLEIVSEFTPLWIADGQWVLGGVGLVTSAVLMWKVAPRIYQLSRRWLVFVPAGVVLHDPMLLSEVLMLQRNEIVSIALAPADTQAIDLTGFTRGVPLEVQLREMTDVRLTPFAARLFKTTDALHVQAFLVAPTQPWRVLTK
ncbi:MAG: hypothetical protein ACYC06_11525 [Ilumatobacteraceae bacterium]